MFTHIKPTKPRVLAGLVGASAIALTSPFAVSPASAVSELVTGKFDTRVVIGADCGTPSGICARGTTTGNLKGAFTLGVSEVIPTSDTPATGVVLFIGDATIETKDGTLGCKNSGLLQTNGDGVLTSLCVVTPGSGTGAWANASGYFQVDGVTSIEGGSAPGAYRGRIARGG